MSDARRLRAAIVEIGSEGLAALEALRVPAGCPPPPAGPATGAADRRADP